jgi:hypothetical protein
MEAQTGLTRPARRPDLDRLLKALIEEAWRRARRRRRVYAGVAFSIAVLGAIVLATFQGPAKSQSGSEAVLAGPNAQAPRSLAGTEHTVHAVKGFFRLKGKRGRITVIVRFAGFAESSWEIARGPGSSPLMPPSTGQYLQIRGGGHFVEAGGSGTAWYARLVGYVTPKGGPRQHVVVKLKGRRPGTFVIIPTKPGALKGDSGTHDSEFLG